ncbi:regulator of G-protein signaling protein-like [Corvus hawaiiensis]|uniref:regulator of G-protein signaling protein-like n=1 Tax=Corvus hawaiiensis TaxID=134902 RepID=UPI002019C0C5|nr:regulator of G-protein signaling protein-like [Corvus hawaiiensis]
MGRPDGPEWLWNQSVGAAASPELWEPGSQRQPAHSCLTHSSQAPCVFSKELRNANTLEMRTDLGSRSNIPFACGGARDEPSSAHAAAAPNAPTALPETSPTRASPGSSPYLLPAVLHRLCTGPSAFPEHVLSFNSAGGKLEDENVRGRVALWNTAPEHNTIMMTAASIASMDMGLLLRDHVFVDFFNTFLNLPVFGQTPIYISGMGRWYLWPELPSHLPWAEHKPFKVLLQFMGSIYEHRDLERRRACVVAEKDTNISPLSLSPFCLSIRVAFIAIKQQGAFPTPFPCSRDLLLTLIPGQEPAPSPQLILSLGTGFATQDPSPAALLAWLEKHRLPHFCKSSLCLHLVLCQKLLGFIRSVEAAELLNWQSADQWLLERCISGSHGMRHFRAFVQGTAGEELIDFWLITERLLDLDESDRSQRDLFLSLVHRLRATHLREGSSVITLCTTISGSLPKAKHIQSISTRREILSKMQEQALFMIQSYWLPKFFMHCKMGMEEEESCQPLLQEYQERLSQASWQEAPGLSEPFPTMHIKRRQGVSGPYCSLKTKAEMWALVKDGRDTQEVKMATFQVKPERQPGPAGRTEELCLDKDALGSIPQQSEHPANTAFGGKRGVTFPGRPQSSAEQDLENLCKEKIFSDLLPSASLAQLPSLKKPVKTLDFLPWALSAEACAGRPFRDFLQCQNRSMETHLLDLWHDLEEFLPVVLDSSRENSFFLHHLIGEKICKTYLEEDSFEKLPLDTRTVVSLWNHLMCGEFSPWIFRAQKEICKAPGSDVPMPKVPGHAAGRWEHFYLSQRMNQSLKLSQVLHGTRSLEGISSEHWQLLAARDLQKGGSIQAEMKLFLGSTEFQRMMADELAVGSPSKEEELLQLMSAALAVASERIARENAAAAARKKSSRRHRSGTLQHRALLFPLFQIFPCHATAPSLVIWPFQMAAGLEEETLQISRTDNPKAVKCKKRAQGRVSSALYHCPTSSRNRKILESKDDGWVTNPTAKATPAHSGGSKQEGSVQEQPLADATCTMSPQQWAWDAIRELVRSFCKFQREMENYKRRVEFEEFLRQERGNERENLPIKEKKSQSLSRTPRSLKGKARLEKVTLIKRCILDKQVIVVNFLVDDLRFYLEMDKFSRLADSVEAVAPCSMQSEKHIAFLKKKLDIISRLFLNSDIPPKLRVNISDKERDLIWRLSSKGPVTRAIYHNAKVTLFPILMYFWRRYLSIPSLPRWRRLCGCQPLSPATRSSDMLKMQMKHSPGAQLEFSPWSFTVSGVSHAGSAPGQ